MRGDNTVGEGLVMPNMTTEEVRAYFAKQNVKEYAVMEVGRNYSPVDVESELHNDIIAECNRRGWIYFHGSMAVATARTESEPDFEILADGGRFFLIECKSKSGKPTPGQLGMRAWAEKLGHKIHHIRSMEEFYEITKL